MIKHRPPAGTFLRFMIALAVITFLLGGDVGRAGAAATPPNGLTGAFGENDNASEVVPSSGAMTYSVPFDLPAARGTAQPSLGLHYRSGTATAEAGEGWSLGLPSIERAPLSGWPKYADNGLPDREDRYTYGGQALTFVCVIGGTPACPESDAVGPMPSGWAGQRHYRLQVEGSFERFFLSVDRQTWTVQKRGGEILEFGAPVTRPTLGGGGRDIGVGTSVFRWNLVRQRDLHGDRNLIVYVWAGVAPERQYLVDVYYSPRVGGGANLDDFAYHVGLRWEAPSYRQIHYTRMDKRRHMRRLLRVAIASKTWADAANRELVRAYALSYFVDRTVPPTPTQAPLWGRSTLKSVALEGGCGVAEVGGIIPYPTGCPSLPAATFEYQPASLITAGGVAIRSSVSGSLHAVTGSLPQAVQTTVFDFNRDGLPDIVEGWPQNTKQGPLFSTNPVCNYVNEYVRIEQTGAPAPIDPRLVCGNHGTLRSARELNAYANVGVDAAGALNLQHNCVDGGTGQPGTLTGYHINNSGLAREASLFGQFSAEAIGVWGDAAILWSVAGYGGFRLEPDRGSEPPTGAAHYAEAYCPNVRGQPGATYNTLKWTNTRAVPNVWAKYPDPSQTIPYHTVIDVDGDGYADMLTDPSTTGTTPYFKRSAVRFTKRISHLETVDGITGPALIPLASGDSAAITVAPIVGASSGALNYSTYVDINGDGLVDLVTAVDGVAGGAPEVRPGDGRGGFGCDSARDVACVVAGNGSWLGKAYRLSTPDAVKPWPLRSYEPYKNGDRFTHFFHDVTGDGLPDLVGYKPQTWPITGSSPPGQIKLWINVDGTSFKCANTTDCVVATISGTDQPAGVSSAYHVTFADIDGNGTEDFVLLGTNGVWHFSFLTVAPLPAVGPRSPRPGLLTRIKNGLGAETEVAYETIQELKRLTGDPDPESFFASWQRDVPAVVPVVTRIATRDSRVVGGAQPIEPYQVDRTTRFQYRDPVYDAWDRSFRGWNRVRTIHPSGAAEQKWYWFSSCESDGFIGDCLQGSDRSPDKSLAGAVVRIDRFVPGPGTRPAKWLSTTTHVYGAPTAMIEPPGTTPDRSVVFTPIVQTDTVLFDAALPVDLPSTNVLAHPTLTQPRPYQTGYEAHLRTQFEFDGAGNSRRVDQFGRLTANELPMDDVITSLTLPSSGRCESDWACQASASETHENYLRAEGRRRRHTAFTYNTSRDLTGVWATLEYPDGTPAGLTRDLAYGTDAPPAASTLPGLKHLREFTVDVYGNVTLARGMGSSGIARPCTSVTYDREYKQFPQRVAQFSGTDCSGVALETMTTFDRGLGELTSSLYPNATMATREYDSFGRLAAIYAPAPDLGPYATELSVQIDHHSQSPVSWTQVRRKVGVDRYLTSIEIANGIGEPVLGFDQADVSADGAPWIARGWTERDETGEVVASQRAWFFSGDPYAVAATAPSLVPASSRLLKVHDEFGRPTFAYDGPVPTASITHHPLEVVYKDAEQLKGSGPYAGLESRQKTDGHGRTIETTTPSAVGTSTTRISYLGTGETRSVERSDTGSPASYVRTMGWDSFGRMIWNQEPNSGTWWYVYDDESRLVGTSDARGCGKNLHYDALGRKLAEDFSPCAAEQEPYTAPNLDTGDGTEVFYRYDVYEVGQLSSIPGFADDDALGAGYLVAVQDRGAHTRINRDGRGRARHVTRRIAKPGASEANLADRYSSHWFAQDMDFDLGDRPTTRSSGLQQPELTGGGASFETMAYSERGALREIGSSYGSLVRELSYSASGLPLHARYGDRAGTQTENGYDERNRLRRSVAWRATAPVLWSTNTPDYPQPDSFTTQLSLTDLEFDYDDVGNPKTINDTSADMWPSGANPVSRAFQYNAAYSLAQVDYAHLSDVQVPAYEAESQSGSHRPVPEAPVAHRVQTQWFYYDGLGNRTYSGDDNDLRFDRSLGPTLHGTGVDGVERGPNQLIDADGIHAEYDRAGNLTELTVARPNCSVTMPDCSHRLIYDWDEVGQMSRARRWDFAPGPVPAYDPSVAPVWDLSYAYAVSGRTRTTKKDALGVERHTLDVFETLRIVSSAYEPVAADYDISPENEVGFLGGMARVFYDRNGVLPIGGDTPLHVYLNIADHLGSTAFVLDKDSGELVERTSHQAYGAIDSDYRPGRWGASREAYKFTGKEEDIEVGVTYFGARYYNARLGTWMSPDPLTVHALGADMNPYAYVGGRVSSYVDPFGLDACGGDGTVDCVVVKGEPRGSARLHNQDRVNTPAPSSDATSQRANHEAVQAWLAHLPDVFNGSVRNKEIHGKRYRGPWSWAAYARGVWNGSPAFFAGPMGVFVGMLAVPRIDNDAYDWGQVTPHAVVALVLPVVGLRGAAAESGAGFPGWATIGETPGGAVAQATPLACGAACGEMVSGIPQAVLLPKVGAPAAPNVLGGAIGGRGGYVGPQAFGQLVEGKPWIAMMRGDGALHYVVVDGVEGGNVMIRDPWAGGSTYGMSQKSFFDAWTGVAVGHF